VEGLETVFERTQCSRHTCIPHADATDEILFYLLPSLLAAAVLLGGGGWVPGGRGSSVEPQLTLNSLLSYCISVLAFGATGV
jgi:hypothetical protein